jgi:hypothetical protein
VFEDVLAHQFADDLRRGDNPVAYAFVGGDYSSDWARLKKQAESLAERVPLDFAGQVKRLRRNAVQPSAACKLSTLFTQR